MEFLKSKLDSTNFWFACIIAALLFLHLYTLVWFFLALMIILPESQFTGWFKAGADKIKSELD